MCPVWTQSGFLIQFCGGGVQAKLCGYDISKQHKKLLLCNILLFHPVIKRNLIQSWTDVETEHLLYNTVDFLLSSFSHIWS